MKNLIEKSQKLLLFLEENKFKVPSALLKAEFQFYFHEIQSEFENISENEIADAMKEVRKLLAGKKDQEVLRAYSVYYKMYIAEEKKNHFKIDVN